MGDTMSLLWGTVSFLFNHFSQFYILMKHFQHNLKQVNIPDWGEDIWGWEGGSVATSLAPRQVWEERISSTDCPLTSSHTLWPKHPTTPPATYTPSSMTITLKNYLFAVVLKISEQPSCSSCCIHLPMHICTGRMHTHTSKRY